MRKRDDSFLELRLGALECGYDVLNFSQVLSVDDAVFRSDVLGIGMLIIDH